MPEKPNNEYVKVDKSTLGLDNIEISDQELARIIDEKWSEENNKKGNDVLKFSISLLVDDIKGLNLNTNPLFNKNADEKKVFRELTGKINNILNEFASNENASAQKAISSIQSIKVKNILGKAEQKLATKNKNTTDFTMDGLLSSARKKFNEAGKTGVIGRTKEKHRKMSYGEG